MAKTTIVGGTTTNTIGEVNAYFSDGSTVTDVKLASVYKGATKGANLGNFKSKPQPTPEYNLNIDLAWLSMVIMYDDTWYTVGETYFQRPGNDTYKFKLVHAQREEFWGFRFYVFGFIMYDKEFYTGVFMGTRTNNWYSLTDNVSQAARISVQVKWAKEMGVYCRRHFPNIIFAGHSKGGREAAFAAVHHGFATVYSYNTSIAYLEDQRKKLTEWQQNGGVMIHYTVAGEVPMMSGLNGWNGGFKPTILTPDGVLLGEIRNC